MGRPTPNKDGYEIHKESKHKKKAVLTYDRTYCDGQGHDFRDLARKIQTTGKLPELQNGAFGNYWASDSFVTDVMGLGAFFKVYIPAYKEKLFKLIDDGYLFYILSCLRDKKHSNRGHVFYGNYRNISPTKDCELHQYNPTYDIKKFIKAITPKAWKQLISLTPVEQHRLLIFVGNVFYTNNFGAILRHKLNEDDIRSVLRIVGINPSLFYENNDHAPVISGETLISFYRSMKDNGKTVDEFNQFMEELDTHCSMWDKVNNEGKVTGLLSAKWSYRRFKDEHKKLSIRLVDMERRKELELEHKNRWKRKKYYADLKIKPILDFNIMVDSDGGKKELKVEFINTPKELMEESRFMKHCVYDYNKSVLRGTMLVFRVIDTTEPKNRGTLAYNAHSDNLSFQQMKDRNNDVGFTFDIYDVSKLVLAKLEETGVDKYFIKYGVRNLTRLKYAEDSIRYTRRFRESVIKPATANGSPSFNIMSQLDLSPRYGTYLEDRIRGIQLRRPLVADFDGDAMVTYQEHPTVAQTLLTTHPALTGIIEDNRMFINRARRFRTGDMAILSSTNNGIGIANRTPSLGDVLFPRIDSIPQPQPQEELLVRGSMRNRTISEIGLSITDTPTSHHANVFDTDVNRYYPNTEEVFIKP